MNAKSIGLKIQEVRLMRGLTQAELSQRIDVTPKYISNIECSAKVPKFETFVEIANALEIDANTLLADELVAMPKVHASQLWDRIAGLAPERQKHVLRMIDVMLEEK